jgi:hypothetical protein
MKIRSQGRQGLLSVLGMLAVATTLVVSGSAQAQGVDQAAVDKLINMNKKALEDYDTLEWESAKRTLLEALVAGKKAGLENHPIMARTYVHLGAVYVTGLKDRNKGVQSFIRAIEIDPSIRISKAMSAPDLEEAFADAMKQAKPRAPAPAAAPPPPPPPVEAPPPKRRAPVIQEESTEEVAPAPKRRAPVMQEEGAEAPPPPRKSKGSDDESGDPDLPVHINALDCPTPDDVPPDKSVKLRCAAAANLNLSRVFLMYRLPGSEEFGSVEMERTSKGWFQGKIPKKAVTGKSVQFYFEGRNAGGKPVVSNGRSDSPNLILIREKGAAEEAEAEAAEAAGSAVDTEENPLDERNEAAGPRLYLGKVDKSRIGLDTRYGNRRWWLGIGVGSGWGYAKGDGLEVRTELQSGFAAGFGWAGLGHLAPELGLQVTPDFAISIQGRNQWIPQPEKYSKYTARGAHSVLLRLLFFQKQQRVRFFGALMGGAGEGFRFVLKPDPKRPDFKDTVRGGPYLAGLGGGINIELASAVSFVLELNALAGFPIFSVVADVNAAIQFNFGGSRPSSSDRYSDE